MLPVFYSATVFYSLSVSTMSSSRPSETQILIYTFAGTLALTFLVYVLRGLGVPGFTALPGGVVWLLILLSIATGIVYGVQKTRRY